MSDGMPPHRRNLLIGGAILLAVPFFAGLLRRSHIQVPREVMIGLVILAGIGAVIGFYVMSRKGQDGARG